jgi:hypothetical protein
MAEDASIGSGNDKVRALIFDKETVDKVGKTFEVVNKIEILTSKPDIEELDIDAEEQEDSKLWNDWKISFTEVMGESGTTRQKCPSFE